MLKYFKKELFPKERCVSLVNEKSYNPKKRNENTMSAFLSGQQKLCRVYCQGEISQQNVRRGPTEMLIKAF